jgi:hypothetical protein
MGKSNWKITFISQLSTGIFWKRLFGDDFNKQLFLNRSDAVTICKEAQSNVYEDIIDELKGRVDESIIMELESKLEKYKNNDMSSLGMGISVDVNI